MKQFVSLDNLPVACVEKDEEIENVKKQVRFSSDIYGNENKDGDPKGVDVKEFSTQYRKRIEGIDGLRFKFSVAKNLSSPSRMDSTKKAYVEVLKNGLSRFKNPSRKVRNML